MLCGSINVRERPWFSKVRLKAQVGVSHTSGSLVSCRSVDGEIRGIYIDFEVVRQAVVEFEVRCILFQIRVLKLKSIIFIEELEVPFSRFRDCGIIGIKRQLSIQPLVEAKHADYRQ